MTERKLHKIIKPQTYPNADIKYVKVIDSSLSHYGKQRLMKHSCVHSN